MQYPDKRKLFTIRETAHACGVSRTTLIRMEESGFLTPFYTDPETGYRYYDADNLTAIGQYQLLQQMGLSRTEIADVYYRRIDSAAFIQEQKAKIARLSRLISELEMRTDHRKNFTTSFVDLPEMVCYCIELKGETSEAMETASYVLYGQCAEKGLRMRGTEPLFITQSDDFRIESLVPQKAAATFNIPVLEPLDADPHLRLFPATRAFSMLAFGDYFVLPELCGKFWQEVEERRLELTGPVRLIALVAPYTGAHIKAEDFCCEIVAPVADYELRNKERL